MKQWYTVTELVDLAPQGLPACSSRISRLARNQEWRRKLDDDGNRMARKRAGRGGGYEYHWRLFPATTQQDLFAQAQLSKPLAGEKHPAMKPLSSPPSCREVMNARLALLAELDKRALQHNMSRRQVMDWLLRELQEDMIDDGLKKLIVKGNARRKKASLTRSTLYTWYKARDKGGESLAPSVAEKPYEPVWLSLFLKHWQRPQKPSIQAAYEALLLELSANQTKPSYEQVRRAVHRMHNVERYKGREGARTLRARQAFVVRDTSDLLPTSVYIADGHTFDAEVTHPLTGKAFRPEITSVLDVATRKLVGFSVGLSESAHTVMDALTHAIADYGIPAVFYTDHGKGYKNHTLDDPLAGLLGRLSITKMESLPYNSQARGVVERFHRTVWVRAARDLPTFMGLYADKEARHNVYKLTRKDIKKFGHSPVLIGWKEFMEGCKRIGKAYNARAHKGLPKIRDAQTGKLRHRSPDEHWVCHEGQGFAPVVVEGGLNDIALKPHMKRKTRRGMVDWMGNRYFARALEAYHEEDVMVAYDIHDASKVWVCELVRTPQEITTGRFICEAIFEGNTQRYIPHSAEQQAIERREQGQLRRLEHKKQAIAKSPAGDFLTSISPSNLPQEPHDDMLEDDVALARYALEGYALSHGQREILLECLREANARMLFEMEGLDIAALTVLVKKEAVA